MRILILNYEYPPLGGGAGVVAKYHAEGLAKKGHEVTVLSTWFQGEKDIEKIGNLTIIKVKSKRKYTYKSNPLEMLSWAYKAFSLLKKEEIQFDICFAHYAIPSGMVALWIKQKFKIPYIVISHGEDIPFVNKEVMLKYHILTYFLLKVLFKQSIKNVVLTKYLKTKLDIFTKSKQQNKNMVIPNGCNPELFNPNNNKRPEILKIIYVGRLADVKEPFVFLEAIKLLNTKSIDFIVHIMGDGPLKSKMESFVKKNNLSNKIIFKGWVSKKEMAEEYQSAHLQIISSRFEAFSISALESLFSGVYILSTPVSGNTDIIKAGINGDFYNYKDSVILAKKIESYYFEKFKQNFTLNQKELEYIKKEYSWEHILQQYEHLITSLGL